MLDDQNRVLLSSKGRAHHVRLASINSVILFSKNTVFLLFLPFCSQSISECCAGAHWEHSVLTVSQISPSFSAGEDEAEEGRKKEGSPLFPTTTRTAAEAMLLLSSVLNVTLRRHGQPSLPLLWLAAHGASIVADTANVCKVASGQRRICVPCKVAQRFGWPGQLALPCTDQLPLPKSSRVSTVAEIALQVLHHFSVCLLLLSWSHPVFHLWRPLPLNLPFHESSYRIWVDH